MGETKEERAGEAKFPEPSRPWSVIMGGRDKHRRSGTPGASPEEEARHEVLPAIPPAQVSVGLPRLGPPSAQEPAPSPAKCVRPGSAGRHAEVATRAAGGETAPPGAPGLPLCRAYQVPPAADAPGRREEARMILARLLAKRAAFLWNQGNGPRQAA